MIHNKKLKITTYLLSIYLSFQIYPAFCQSDIQNSGNEFNIDKVVADVKELCGTIPLTQESHNDEVNAKGQLAVNGIMKKIVSTDANASYHSNNNSSTGLLQKDLGEALKSGEQCRMNALQSIMKYYESQNQKTEPTNLDGVYQDGNLVGEAHNVSENNGGNIIFGTIRYNADLDPSRPIKYHQYTLLFIPEQCASVIESNINGLRSNTGNFCRMKVSKIN